MIKIQFSNIYFDRGIGFKDRSKAAGIRVEGHSGTGKKGEDLVCAAVSVLAQTAVAGISRIAEIEQDLTIRDGYISSEFSITGLGIEKMIKLETIAGLLLIGLMEILKNNDGIMEIHFDDKAVKV